MRARRSWRHLARLALLLALAGVLIPDAGTHPTTISLTKVESAKSVDFADGVVWILVLGSDARAGQELTEGNSDAIQLVGIDLQSGRAAGIGIPRDSYFELPGLGLDRINAGHEGWRPSGHGRSGREARRHHAQTTCSSPASTASRTWSTPSVASR